MARREVTFTPVNEEDPACQEMECGVCRHVWLDPTELLPCKHIFCTACLERTGSCPVCRASVVGRSAPHRIMVNTAAELQVRCDRCNATMPNKERRTHTCRSEGVAAAEAQRATTAANMHIFVSTLLGKKLMFYVKPTHTIDTVKSMICEKEGVPPDQQRLIFAGKQLANEYTLASYNVLNGNVIHLVLRQRGGIRIFVTTANDRTMASDIDLNDSSDRVQAKNLNTKGIPPNQ